MPGYTPGEQIADLTKLNTNEGAFPPSARVRAALSAIADESLRLYPDPTSRGLRAVAAARYGVAADEILAGNGSDDCLTVLYRGFLDAGDRVACPWPTYGLYSTLAALQGAELVRLPFVVEGRRFGLPPDLTGQRAKMIILANPNNPTATLVPVEALRALCDEAKDAVVVVDEAYVDFALGAGVDASMLPYLRQHENLVVLRTMSKSFSLAGARLGLLFAAAPVIEQLTKVKDSYNVNAITQAIGIAALEDRAYHADCVGRTLDERARLEAALDALGLTWPESAANFLLVELGERAEEIYRSLKTSGLLVRWWSAPELRTKLRISVGRPADNDRLMVALRPLV
ncbi:MAG TPA: histidinol-phosphate transaminase [Polyangia bacterium]